MSGESFAFQFANGAPAALPPRDALESDQVFSWIHLDFADAAQRPYAVERLQIPSEAEDALWADTTRPRLVEMESGLLVNLRGVNLNPGQEPDDMVSLRLWVTEKHVLTVSLQRFMAVQDLHDSSAAGEQVAGPLDLVLAIAKRATYRIQDAIDNLEDLLDEFEDRVLDGSGNGVLASLASVRRQAIRLRRFISPQREVLRSLVGIERVVHKKHRIVLNELIDRTTRILEDLDAVRERGAVVQDQITAQQSAQMNRTMLVLSVVAAIFLPLSFLTGLLGINVGGIPGTESARAFAVVCGVLIVIALLEVWWVRRSRWMS